MCSLAMSFLFAYYPLLLLWLYLLAYSLCLVCLYFVPGRGCFIAANLVLSLITAARTATMATSTALRIISIGMAPVVAALSFLLYLLWYICTIFWQVLLLSVAAILLAVRALCRTVHIAAMAIYSCRDILWVLALFLVSASMRHTITMIGARYTSSILIWVGVFWSIPAIGDYVDRVMAALLLLFVDALQGHGRCAAAISGFAGSISNFIVKAMKKLRLQTKTKQKQNNK